jgi:hypothetical protein
VRGRRTDKKQLKDKKTEDEQSQQPQQFDRPEVIGECEGETVTEYGKLQVFAVIESSTDDELNCERRQTMHLKRIRGSTVDKIWRQCD